MWMSPQRGRCQEDGKGETCVGLEESVGVCQAENGDADLSRPPPGMEECSGKYVNQTCSLTGEHVVSWERHRLRED